MTVEPGAVSRAGTTSALNMVFIIDDIATLRPEHDTSIALMEAAQLRGHHVRVTTASRLGYLDGEVTARCQSAVLRPAVLHDRKWLTDVEWFTLGEAHRYPLGEADVVFVRTDPPVDSAYLRATYLLDLLDPQRPLVINSPMGLRNANEHLFALRIPELGPETIVSTDRDEIRETVRQWGRAVLKPVEGMAGRGVLMLDATDRNLPSILEVATDRGSTHVVVQKWLPESAQGDRRIIVLDGVPIGAVRRVASEGEFRCNMAAGAAVVEDAVTEADQTMCARLAPCLRAHGLVFAGIDVIGGRLTEVNVTSPTGLREIEVYSDSQLAHDVVGWAEDRCQAGTRHSTP